MKMSKKDLISCIEKFITDKKMIVSETPTTIKKKELETFLEEFAAEQGIDYEKKAEPTNTIYFFTIEGQEAHVEFYYRYGQYYTRHSISLK